MSSRNKKIRSECNLAYCTSTTHSSECATHMRVYYASVQNRKLVLCCPHCVRCWVDMSWDVFVDAHLAHAGQYDSELPKKVLSTDLRYRMGSPDFNPSESIVEDVVPQVACSSTNPQRPPTSMTIPPELKALLKARFQQALKAQELKLSTKFAEERAVWNAEKESEILSLRSELDDCKDRLQQAEVCVDVQERQMESLEQSNALLMNEVLDLRTENQSLKAQLENQPAPDISNVNYDDLLLDLDGFID